MAVTDAEPGSRTTPAGKTLSWQTFGLQQWRIAGPHRKNLEQLLQTLELHVDVAEAKATALRLALTCPKGSVTF